MLMTLLPGLRELRTPLACGYIWLLSMWIAFHGKIPSRREATGIARAIYDLSGQTGKPATLAAVSFLAFIIGSIVEIRAVTFFTWTLAAFHAVLSYNILGRNRESGYIYIDRLTVGSAWRPTVYATTFNALEDFIHRSTLETGSTPRPQPRADSINTDSDDRFSPATLGFTVEEMTALVTLRERPQLATKLHLENAELYGDYDRRAAEADFKLNIGIATLVLFFAICGRGTYGAAAGTLVTIVLIWRSLSALRSSNDVLIQSLIARKIHSVAIMHCLETGQAPKPRDRSGGHSEPVAEHGTPPVQSDGAVTTPSGDGAS
ncbi:hypothetical protein ACWERI_08400 [Streptomyces collinus]